MRLTNALFMLLGAACCYAHHGSNAQFDQTQTVELSGTITGIHWVNPHAYVLLDVIAADGTVQGWRCEMRAAAMLQRSGWSQDMFSPGAHIEIEGVPARRESDVCYVRQFSIDGGPVIQRYSQLDEAEEQFEAGDRPPVLENGQPNISGNWAAPQRLLQQGELRRRSMVGFRGYLYDQSEAGIAAARHFDVARDNPRYNCQAVNIVADWVFDQHVNRIEQSDTSITLSYGFMDIVRTIHLDRDEHPDDIVPSRAGHSIGRWDGNALVVETIGFLPGYLDGRFGIMHSDQLRVVETFEFDPERLSLVRRYTGEDPLYLSSPFESQDAVFLTDTPFTPYDCEDLTTDFGGRD